MDVNKQHVKFTDYREIKMPDGRLIRAFTFKGEGPLWFSCVYEQTKEIAFRRPFMDYQAAFSDFVNTCELLECDEVKIETKTPTFWKGVWFGIILTGITLVALK